MEQKSGLELFEEFYQKQNNQPMSTQQREYVEKLLETDSRRE
jgi:exonuclease SbcD